MALRDPNDPRTLPGGSGPSGDPSIDPPYIPGGQGPYGTYPTPPPGYQQPDPTQTGNAPIDVGGLIAGDAGYQGVRGALSSQFAAALGAYGGLPAGIAKPAWMTDAEWANAQAASSNPYGATEQALLTHHQAAHNVYGTAGAAGGDSGATNVLQGREDTRYTGQSQQLLNALRSALAGYSQQEGTAYGQAADRVYQQYPGATYTNTGSR